MLSVTRYAKDHGYDVLPQHIKGQWYLMLLSQSSPSIVVILPNGQNQRIDLGPVILQTSPQSTLKHAFRAMRAIMQQGIEVWYVPPGKKRQTHHLFRFGLPPASTGSNVVTLRAIPTLVCRSNTVRLR